MSSCWELLFSHYDLIRSDEKRSRGNLEQLIIKIPRVNCFHSNPLCNTKFRNPTCPCTCEAPKLRFPSDTCAWQSHHKSRTSVLQAAECQLLIDFSREGIEVAAKVEETTLKVSLAWNLVAPHFVTVFSSSNSIQNTTPLIITFCAVTGQLCNSKFRRRILSHLQRMRNLLTLLWHAERHNYFFLFYSHPSQLLLRVCKDWSLFWTKITAQCPRTSDIGGAKWGVLDDKYYFLLI